MTHTVLVLDDHSAFRTTISRLLTEQGLEVVCAHDESQALDTVRKRRPRIALVDVGVASRGDFKVVDLMRAEHDPPVVILISAWNKDDLIGLDQVRDIQGFLSKPDISRETILEMLPQ